MIPYRMNPMGVSGLPYKRRLEYLQSTGTQWIDTGVIPTASDTIYFRGWIGHDSIIAGTNNNTGARGRYYVMADNGLYNARFVSDNATVGFSYSYTEVMADGVFNAADHKCYINGTQLSGTLSFAVDYAALYSLYLFASNTASPPTYLGTAAIASFRIERSGSTVCDIIPVLDKQNVPCMFDKVSGTLLYNQGSGQFLYA